MDLSINLKNKKKKSKLILKSIPKNWNIFLNLKLSNSKFARDLKNTQTQTPNTQKIEKQNQT